LSYGCARSSIREGLHPAPAEGECAHSGRAPESRTGEVAARPPTSRGEVTSSWTDTSCWPSLCSPQMLPRVPEVAMFRVRSLTLATVATALVVACASTALVQVPPRVDLHAFETIGIVQFESEAKGNLAAFATQRFIEAMQQSQPGVRVLELGRSADLEPPVVNSAVDHAAIQAIGRKYAVDAVIVGDLAVKNVRPKIDVYNIVESMSVNADVDAGLTTRMLETSGGATVWTRSTSSTRTVAHVGVGAGTVSFDARDPQGAYGELVDALINDITGDFRVSYVRQ